MNHPHNTKNDIDLAAAPRMEKPNMAPYEGQNPQEIFDSLVRDLHNFSENFSESKILDGHRISRLIDLSFRIISGIECIHERR